MKRIFECGERVVALKTGRGGVKIPNYKSATEKSETIYYIANKTVTLGFCSQNFSPCVLSGDKVLAGQMIAKTPDSFPLYSSVSGTVSEVVNSRANGKIVVLSDGEMQSADTIKAPEVNTRKQFIEAAKTSGLYDFDSKIPLYKIFANEKIKYLVINGIEDEPFVTSDHRECFENPKAILDAAVFMTKILSLSGVALVLSRGESAVKLFDDIIGKDESAYESLKIVTAPEKYPSKDADVLLSLLHEGDRAEVCVLNITSASLLMQYLATGVPLIARRITVDGPCIKEPKNVMTPIGCSIGDLIEFTGGFSKDVSKIVLGGAMRGVAVESPDTQTTPFASSVIAFDKENDLSLSEQYACLRCGRCAASCPSALYPMFIEKAVAKKKEKKLKKLSPEKCIGCLTCSFVCPSHRPLAKSVEAAKTLVLEGEK